MMFIIISGVVVITFTTFVAMWNAISSAKEADETMDRLFKERYGDDGEE